MTTISVVPPGIVMILGALLLPALNGGARKALVLLLPLLTLWWVWQLPDGAALTLQFLDYTLTPVEGTRLGRLFATIFAIMAFAGGLYAMNQSRLTEIVAAYIYAGSAIGVALAGDLVTLFVFWEAMALGSTVVLWSAESRASYRASMRYVMIHLFGGVLLMIGVVGQIKATGSVAFVAMQPLTWPTWLILAGFLINAGAPPLSAWLPDAYPEASPGGTVFLSAFTTKTAVYVLLRGFPGAEILVFIGLYMVFYGIVYAILENDMRRMLAYSIVSQVGFMVTAAGIGTQMAIDGAAAHAFVHIIYKGLLMMSAGAVLHMTGRRKLSDLGGLFQSMPLTTICGVVGALSIAAFPLTSGFVSKSMIAQAALDQHLATVWYLLAAASAGTFLYAGLKFPWFVFFQKDSGLRPPDPPLNMRLAMILFAALCVIIGVYPAPLYALLPFPVSYVPYTGGHVLSMLQLLMFSGLAFVVCLPLLKPALTISLDFDWFYRRFFALIARDMTEWASHAHFRLARRLEARGERVLAGIWRHHGPEGILARTWPTGSTVLWVAVLLVIYMVFYFL